NQQVVETTLKNTPTNLSHKFKALQLTFQVVCGSRRKRFKAMWRRTAKVWAPLSLRIRQASSANETSRTPWRELSLPQWCRTAWANRTPWAGRDVRKYRVSTWTVSPTSRRASTIPTLCKLDHEALASSPSISDVIQYRRVSMRP